MRLFDRRTWYPPVVAFPLLSGLVSGLGRSRDAAGPFRARTFARCSRLGPGLIRRRRLAGKPAGNPGRSGRSTRKGAAGAGKVLAAFLSNPGTGRNRVRRCPALERSRK